VTTNTTNEMAAKLEGEIAALPPRCRRRGRYHGGNGFARPSASPVADDWAAPTRDLWTFADLCVADKATPNPVATSALIPKI